MSSPEDDHTLWIDNPEALTAQKVEICEHVTSYIDEEGSRYYFSFGGKAFGPFELVSLDELIPAE